MLRTQRNDMKTQISDLGQTKTLLLSVGGKESLYKAGETVIFQGELQKSVFFIYSGHAHASRTDAEGREEDYAVLEAGDFFGYVLALSEEQKSPVSVIADEDCAIISFPYEALLYTDSADAKILLQTLFNSLVERFFTLQKRVRYLTRASLREKIVSYLSDMSKQAGSDAFAIPLDRNALAAFLYCDRSALSRELSSMKKEGLIDYSRNRFVILHRHFSKND